MINWHSEEIYIATSDVVVEKQIRQLVDRSPHLNSHIFIRSSGTMGEPKWVCLSKKAFLASAAAVNQNLLSSPDDVWLQSLPLNHVGGLSIYARAYLSGAKVVEWHKLNPKWNAEKYYQALKENQATLTSLVPTQVYDLVIKNLKAPGTLRAVLVGGAAISESLYLKARSLGWPLLPSYGMTETCSQMASAGLESLEKKEFPKLRILSHVQVAVDEKNILSIQSRSLLTSYLDLNMEETHIISGGWFKTQDLVALEANTIKPLGRLNDQIKISGELVSKSQLQKIFSELSMNSPRLSLNFLEDERLGNKVQLLAEKNHGPLESLVERYNQSVKPFEKIREIVEIEKIPRTILGKFIEANK